MRSVARVLYLQDMGRVTQRVDPSALDALIERRARAAVALAHGTGVEVAPIALRRDCGRLWVGLERGEPLGEATSLPVVVMVDDGRYWFELRAITWRGRLVPASVPPKNQTEDLRWFEFLVEDSVSWDYGTLHEEL